MGRTEQFSELLLRASGRLSREASLRACNALPLHAMISPLLFLTCAGILGYLISSRANF